MFSVDDVSTWIILMVEDDDDNIEMARQVFMFNGLDTEKQFHIALDGNAGLEKLKTVKPHVILLDLSMPEVDGWQMHQQVRANPETAQIPVIAVTAHAMNEDRKRAIAAGFNGYIVKPYSIHNFLPTIKQVLTDHYQNHMKSGEE